MMIDWGGLLARKYDIMQQNADSQRLGVNAAAELDRTRAGLLPAESAANIALTGAQRGLAQANTRNTDETTAYIAPLAKANIGYIGAQAGEASARRGLINSQRTSVDQTNDPNSFLKKLGFGMLSDDVFPSYRPLGGGY